MKRWNEQYIINERSEKTAVILPIDRYEELIEDLYDLCIMAERKDEPTISHEEMKKKLKADGLLMELRHNKMMAHGYTRIKIMSFPCSSVKSVSLTHQHSTCPIKWVSPKRFGIDNYPISVILASTGLTLFVKIAFFHESIQ